MSETRATYLTKESTMSTDLDLATLDHWFGWMRNSESWRREREIVYGMWAEIERLRERVTTRAELVEFKRAEIERLRGEVVANAGTLGKLHSIIGAQEGEIERLRALLNNMLTDTQCMHWHEDIRAELGE